MRRLKTLNRDVAARNEVALASEQAQSGDHMDFGLLCFERGRLAGHREAGSEEAFLAACAKDCRCCPNCGNPPCPACTAGGICDESDCYCGDAMHDEPYEAQGLDTEDELP